MHNTIFVVLGPTCSGKTSLAIDLCKKYAGEIISADSRQLYKHMDIGTGKSPVDPALSMEKGDEKWRIDGVDIWGYDLVEPNEFFTVHDYALFALKKARVLMKEKVVFLVGGTGFYIDTVTGNVTLSGILPNFELRNELKSKTLNELLILATSLNVSVKNESEMGNKQRLIRTLEKAQMGEKDSIPLPYLTDAQYVLIGLEAERSFLYQKADDWVVKIWGNGLVDEVENLRKLGYGNSPKLKSLIYGQVSDYIDGKDTEADCVQKMKYAMHSYIRRQETYFKKVRNIHWYDVSEDSYKQNVYNQVERYVG
ncbi:MAG: tRNA (adenosine(37)-N6)-dimethylallyltransferase MiaA [Patescibacteria group bacterium]